MYSFFLIDEWCSVEGRGCDCSKIILELARYIGALWFLSWLLSLITIYINIIIHGGHTHLYIYAYNSE